eukprot:8437528-Ditylum_brightwellii.AAC.1
MAGCTDFVEEETLLQHRAHQLGQHIGISVAMDCMPKGCPELTGNGLPRETSQISPVCQSP